MPTSPSNPPAVGGLHWGRAGGVSRLPDLKQLTLSHRNFLFVTLKIWLIHLFPQMSLNYFKLIMKCAEDKSQQAIFCIQGFP